MDDETAVPAPAADELACASTRKRRREGGLAEDATNMAELEDASKNSLARRRAKAMESEAKRLRGQHDRLYKSIAGRLSGVQLNGDAKRRLPGNLNLGFDGITGADLMAALEGLSISSGSACISAAVEPSYVLRAIGLDDAAADASIRIGFGRSTTDEELIVAADIIVTAVSGLRDTTQSVMAD